MLIKNSTHGVKKVLEIYISTDALKFQNRRLIYGKIVKNKSRSKMLDFLLGPFEKMWCAIKNRGK